MINRLPNNVLRQYLPAFYGHDPSSAAPGPLYCRTRIYRPNDIRNGRDGFFAVIGYNLQRLFVAAVTHGQQFAVDGYSGKRAADFVVQVAGNGSAHLLFLPYFVGVITPGKVNS